MNCSRFETLLTDYIDHTLDLRVESAMNDHLRGCSDCASLLKEVEQLCEDLVDFLEVEPPAGLTEKILERTTGKPRVRSLWADLIIPTVRPFLTQRFAFATAMMFVFLSLVVNLVGPGFSAFSYNKFTPSAIMEQADRVSTQVYQEWMKIKDAKARMMGELKLLSEDLYGRIDYHLINMLFRSYNEPEQKKIEDGGAK